MTREYCYPETNVLKNKFGLRNQEFLDMEEAKHVQLRLVKVFLNPLSGPSNLIHFKKIHGYLFQDVYDWAGQLREVNMTKYYPQIDQVKGFASVQFIESYLQDVFQQLQNENYLKDHKQKDDFSRRCGYYMSEINAVHPFREGNGRTQREFFRCLALNAGYNLDWTLPPAYELTKARAMSIDDSTYLGDLIKDSITNKTPNQ